MSRENAVIHATENLARRQNRREEELPQSSGFESTVPRQERQRHPERQLHFEMIEVVEPERRKGEDEAAEEAGGCRPAQMPHQRQAPTPFRTNA